jgi:hypothetical protein
MAALDRVGEGRSRSSGGRSRTTLALWLQLAALVVLASSLLGAAWLDPRSRMRLLVLVDRSQSVPRALADAAIAGFERSHWRPRAPIS